MPLPGPLRNRRDGSGGPGSTDMSVAFSPSRSCALPQACSGPGTSPAVEGLARVDVLCIDKTGTLTEGGLEVESVIPLGDGPTAESEIAMAAMATADSSPNATPCGPSRDGSPTRSPVGYAATGAFTSARRWSGWAFGEHGTWVPGAPAAILTSGAGDAIRSSGGNEADAGKRGSPPGQSSVARGASARSVSSRSLWSCLRRRSGPMRPRYCATSRSRAWR